jgi:hypothetical protein
LLQHIFDYDINRDKPGLETVRHYMPDVALQHLADAKTVIEQIFGKGCWTKYDEAGVAHNGEDWATILRNKLARLMKTRCIDLGQ